MGEFFFKVTKMCYPTTIVLMSNYDAEMLFGQSDTLVICENILTLPMLRLLSSKAQ